MWNMDTTKMAQKIDEMSKDNPKGDESILSIEMWYRRARKYQIIGVSEALNIIWD